MAGLDGDLALALTKRVQQESCLVSVLIQDQTRKTFAYREQEVFPGASLLKIGIADYVKCAWEKNPEILQEKLTVSPKQRVSGAGVMHHLSQNEWSLRDVLALMLSTSDNTAANVLLDRFGRGNVNDWLAEKYPGMQLQRYFIAPVVDGQDNFLTAEALLPAWQALFDGANEFAQLCQTSLHEQTDRTKLVYYADDLQFVGDTFNKTGDLANMEHDCARIQLEQTWFDCIVLTKFDKATTHHHAALKLQQDIGRLLLQKVMSE
ncbi:serine hydrolase [Ligilactobacillus pobuzihii]|uniref:Beta-lactamase class A n=1 Tax=Ligilactobacillus pobuzihii TaxID=449659 RepID=A0A0R2LIK2_9LACO|nr:serine hydrolase [Ligilactobacillus pobuzihii]KRK09219.1 Beta-lactamase class A [Ligilactobacillus pobuzihii E100301 = KCTC 13174]KRO01382.1 Beta-lactamase class A [Ligilactobacillus pobuzihii]GEN49132.1 hypothetical protein LPO01_19240 [Ligilactobacillus pobuzihii]